MPEFTSSGDPLPIQLPVLHPYQEVPPWALSLFYPPHSCCPRNLDALPGSSLTFPPGCRTSSVLFHRKLLLALSLHFQACKWRCHLPHQHF